MINSLYDKFKPWSDGGSVWLISDPHFGYDNECLQMNPNYLSSFNPDEYVDILNKSIHKSDTLVCLGDCGDLEYFTKLKVRYRVLVKGNHDDKGNSTYKPYFDEIYNGPLFISDRILLSHEPINGLPFCLNIHGHVHGGVYDYTDSQGGKHLNLAADVIQWQPVELKKLINAGAVAGISSIHRITIDRAVKNKELENKECQEE